MSTEPPSPVPPPRSPLSRFLVMLIVISLIPSLVFGALVVLRLFGMVRPFYMPTSSMAPALIHGDHIIMESVTYLEREPRRGEIVAYNSYNDRFSDPGTIFAKRIVGEPGDRLLISGGNLYINERLVIISNEWGPISYDLPSSAGGFMTPITNLTVPPDCYFMVGDNSTNSYDSRYTGAIPRKYLLGRILFCYWPPDRFGEVK